MNAIKEIKSVHARLFFASGADSNHKTSLVYVWKPQAEDTEKMSCVQKPAGGHKATVKVSKILMTKNSPQTFFGNNQHQTFPCLNVF